jgi:hypothetical protein
VTVLFWCPQSTPDPIDGDAINHWWPMYESYWGGNDNDQRQFVFEGDKDDRPDTRFSFLEAL